MPLLISMYPHRCKRFPSSPPNLSGIPNKYFLEKSPFSDFSVERVGLGAGGIKGIKEVKSKYCRNRKKKKFKGIKAKRQKKINNNKNIQTAHPMQSSESQLRVTQSRDFAWNIQSGISLVQDSQELTGTIALSHHHYKSLIHTEYGDTSPYSSIGNHPVRLLF